MMKTQADRDAERTPGFCGPGNGEPLARVPHGKTVHRTVFPPLLSF